MEVRDFKPRLYQETIFNTAVSKNTLVILATGLGKTYLSLLLAAHRLTNFPGSKVLLLAPTRPLVMQHFETFRKHLVIDEDKLILFTGAVKPEKREQMWKKAAVVFSTPQGLANDIINNKINLEEVSCLVLDEVHHAVGNYDYCFICKEYQKKARYPRILGLTASPGSDLEKIEEVCNNTFMEDIEIRMEDDPDVRPYIQEKEIKYVLVDLPQNFREIKKFLDDCFKSKLKKLKDLGVASIGFSKKDLLQLQKELHKRLASGEKDFTLWHAVSYLAQLMKVHHALELFETQGTNAAYKYMNDVYESAERTKVKAVKNLVRDLNFKSAFLKIKSLVESSVEHPKLGELKKIIRKEVDKNPKIKIIVFNHYRDSANKLVNELNKVENVNAHLFIGQTKKGGIGLSQKEQIKILKDFKENKFNVLVGTSVTEEGLDIFAVDLVIFYEPIPSAIRSIQRKGRTGRTEKGRVIVLVTKNTRDEIYRWTAHHKEKRMHRSIKELKQKLKFKQSSLSGFIDKNELRIVADYREKGSAVVKELISLGVSVEMQDLAMGDYLISERVICELKQQQDFLKSIMDGRLTKQVKQLRDNYQRPLVILEGSGDLYSLRKMHPNAVRGMLAAIIISYGVPIVFTKNPKDSAGLLLAIAKREQQGALKELGMQHDRKPLTTKEAQEFIIESLPGIGPSSAKSLLKKFKTVKNIVNAEENSLKETEKVGAKRAKEIKRIVEEMYED